MLIGLSTLDAVRLWVSGAGAGEAAGAPLCVVDVSQASARDR
jgi:hypothetical protein